MRVPANEPPARTRGRADAAGSAGPDSLRGRVERPSRETRRALLSAAVMLAGAYVCLTAVWTGLGFLVTGPLADGWLGNLDRNVATWLVQRRTPALDGLSQIGSMLAETMVKVVVTAVVAIVLLIAWRRLREPFLICFALFLEASVFITVTWLVDRRRPDVDPLEEVSVGTSFPSGHAAAAAAYAAVAIVVFERTRSVWIRTLTAGLAVAVPLVVGISRMYRGVHYLTDVLAGIALGAVCVAAVYVIVRRNLDRRGRAGHPSRGSG